MPARTDGTKRTTNAAPALRAPQLARQLSGERVAARRARRQTERLVAEWLRTLSAPPR